MESCPTCRRKWEEGNECGGFMCVRGEVDGASAETEGASEFRGLRRLEKFEVMRVLLE